MLEIPGGWGIGGDKGCGRVCWKCGWCVGKGGGICNEVEKIIVADIENMGIWLPLGYNKGELCWVRRI